MWHDEWFYRVVKDYIEIRGPKWKAGNEAQDAYFMALVTARDIFVGSVYAASIDYSVDGDDEGSSSIDEDNFTHIPSLICADIFACDLASGHAGDLVVCNTSFGLELRNDDDGESDD